VKTALSVIVATAVRAVELRLPQGVLTKAGGSFMEILYVVLAVIFLLGALICFGGIVWLIHQLTNKHSKSIKSIDTGYRSKKRELWFRLIFKNQSDQAISGKKLNPPDDLEKSEPKQLKQV
jgi:hypothetical protein